MAPKDNVRKPLRVGQEVPSREAKNATYVVKSLALTTHSHYFYKCRRIDQTKNDKRKVVMKAVYREDEILGTVYYEKVAWTFMRRYSPFIRLNMPIEKCNKRSLPFPAVGMNLEQLRKKHGVFPLEAVIRIGMDMLAAIRELHECGIVHRNIKPNHFCMDLESNSASKVYGKWVLIDMSQVKPYFQFAPYINFIPPIRAEPDLQFCSINSSNTTKTVGRNDDLVAWFHIMLWLRCPTLPWANTTDPTKITELKQKVMQSLPHVCRIFGPVLGEAMTKIGLHLRMCSNLTMPRYGKIYKLLYRALKKITGGKLLETYCSENATLPMKALEELKNAVVCEPQFTYFSQTVDLDINYGQTGRLFCQTWSENKYQAEFDSLDKMAIDNRRKYMGDILDKDGYEMTAFKNASLDQPAPTQEQTTGGGNEDSSDKEKEKKKVVCVNPPAVSPNESNDSPSPSPNIPPMPPAPPTIREVRDPAVPFPEKSPAVPFPDKKVEKDPANPTKVICLTPPAPPAESDESPSPAQPVPPVQKPPSKRNAPVAPASMRTAAPVQLTRQEEEGAPKKNNSGSKPPQPQQQPANSNDGGESPNQQAPAQGSGFSNSGGSDGAGNNYSPVGTQPIPQAAPAGPNPYSMYSAPGQQGATSMFAQPSPAGTGFKKLPANSMMGTPNAAPSATGSETSSDGSGNNYGPVGGQPVPQAAPAGPNPYSVYSAPGQQGATSMFAQPSPVGGNGGGRSGGSQMGKPNGGLTPVGAEVPGQQYGAFGAQPVPQAAPAGPNPYSVYSAPGQAGQGTTSMFAQPNMQPAGGGSGGSMMKKVGNSLMSKPSTGPIGAGNYAGPLPPGGIGSSGYVADGAPPATSSGSSTSVGSSTSGTSGTSDTSAGSETSGSSGGSKQQFDAQQVQKAGGTYAFSSSSGGSGSSGKNNSLYL